MKIIEKYINSKTGDLSVCEDSIVFNDHFISIVDGSTSKSPIRFNGKKNGKIASEIISNAIENLPFDISAENAFLVINKAIVSFYIKENIYHHMESNSADRCTASVLIYSQYHKELWFVGDCQALVDGKLITNIKNVDNLFENLRAFYLEYELLCGKTIDELRKQDTGREIILPLIEKQTKFQNIDKTNEFAYETMDGFFRDTALIKKVPITENTQYIVLASDGYPQLLPTLNQSEKVLAETIEIDPLCFREFKTTKGVVEGNISYDDRSYIKFSI